MNSREQILAKRVAALEARLQASMVVIDHLIKDLEFTESVGAAFAWDLMADLELTRAAWADCAEDMSLLDVTSDEAEERWDEAVAALEAERAK